MSTPTLDPVLADAIERELAAIGTTHSRLQRHQRRTRALVAVAGTVALAGALTGAAIVVGLPGETTVSPLGGVVTGSYTGTAEVELGAVPADAGAVILDVTCTEGGTISLPLTADGESVSWVCGDPISADTVHIDDGRLPEPGSTSVTVTADPGTKWSVVAQYARTATSAWGVNEAGQTYGVPNDEGTPDLTPALATNGRTGYIVSADVFSVQKGFLPVYESDGATVVGEFPIGQ
jgi:hypothetical protein